MILWVNGPFGAGKTTLCRALEARPDVTVVDAEQPGYLLQPILGPKRPVRNFQDWPAWRVLAADLVRSVHEELGGVVVVPQSVFVEAYWDELLAGIGEPVVAVTLHVDRAALERRIRRDLRERSARRWRLEQVDAYEAARPWLESRSTTIDTTELSPSAVAEAVSAMVP